MTEYQKETDSNRDRMPYVRTVIGLLVLTAGLTVAFSVVQEAFNIINGEGTYGILEKIFSADEIGRTIKTTTDDVQLPQSLYTIVGYFLIALLLSICAGIASSVIKSGAKIIRPDYDEIIKRVKQINNSKGTES